MKKRLVLLVIVLVVGSVFGASGQLVGACGVQTNSDKPC